MTPEALPENGSRRWWVWPLLCAAVGAVLLNVFYMYPDRGIGIEQPIPFSHRVHAGVKGISCRFCHPGVARAANAAIPPMEKCLFCHRYVIPKHPEIVKLIRAFDAGTPVRWARAAYVPDYVMFAHEPHMAWGGLECAACHGNVASLDRLPPVDFKMKFCVECHRERNAQLDCWLACHR